MYSFIERDGKVFTTSFLFEPPLCCAYVCVFIKCNFCGVLNKRSLL